MDYWRRPLDSDRITVREGRVYILTERCKGCGFCVEFCPRDVLVMSSRFNRRGYHTPEVKEGGVCLSCDLCEMICPDFAIFSLTIPDEKSPPAGANLDTQGESQGAHRGRV